MMYCPDCEAWRNEEQQDAFGNCALCGTELVDKPPEESAEAATSASPTEELTEPEATAATAPRPEAEEPPPAVEEAVPAAEMGEEEELAPPRAAADAVKTEPATATEPTVEEEVAGEPEQEAATTEYEALVADIEEHLEQGFETFGLVGHASSGKTHCLKALTYLLERHGVGSHKAGFEFRKAPVPGHTAAVVSDYAYTGPADEKWVLMDAGGELYARLRENNWDREASYELTRWLHRCQGLFCFLHLQPGHFRSHALDVDPTLADDPERRRRLQEQQRKAREAKQELEFFKHFLLFLRALKAEQGQVDKVIERCRTSPTLDEALREYHGRAPLLDIPVMFFLTQADSYGRSDFEIAPGQHVNPRRLPLPVPVFVARYLPALFGAVASQVLRFKFDFLQSYEDHPTGKRGEGGVPVLETYWYAPDDDRLLLSAGLMAGLEFVLRNRPRERRWWQLPELPTRPALRLHRWLHPGLWRGVPRNLLRGRRRLSEPAEGSDR